MNFFKKLSKETIIYGFGKGISGLITIFMIPLYTRALGVEGYGLIDLLATVNAFLYMLTVSGLDSAVPFYYFDVKKRYTKKIISFNGFFIRFCLAVILPLLAYPFVVRYCLVLSDKLLVNIEYIVFVALSIIPFLTLQAYSRDFLRIIEKPFYFLYCTVFYSLLSVGSQIFFILILQRSIYGYFEALLFSEFVSGCLFILLIKKYFEFKISRKIIVSLVKYGLPLLPSGLMFLILSLLDRNIVASQLGLEYSGIYALSNKVVAILVFCITSFQLAWGILGLSVKNDKNAKKIYSFVFSMYLLITTFIGICLTLFSKEVVILFGGNDFLEAYKLVGILCLAQIILGLFNQVAIGSIIMRKTINVLKAVTPGVMLNIAFTLLFIKIFGILGGAISKVLGYLLTVAIIFCLSQKIYPIKYNLHIFVVALLLLICVIIFNLYFHISIYFKTGLIIFIFLAYCNILYHEYKQCFGG